MIAAKPMMMRRLFVSSMFRSRRIACELSPSHLVGLNRPPRGMTWRRLQVLQTVTGSVFLVYALRDRRQNIAEGVVRQVKTINGVSHPELDRASCETTH